MKKFKKTYIEITNICNLSCAFCPKTGRKAQFMERELFEKILCELKGHSQFIYFHVLGEPLLHPNLGLYLDLCREYGFKVNITTNGTLIDRVSDLLMSKPALRQVNFSLHSFEGNISDGCGYSPDPYLDSIFSFVRESRKINLLISLRLWNLEEGKSRENNRYILERIEKEFSLQFKIQEELTPCKGIKIGQNIFLNQANTFQWPDMSECEIEGGGFCYGLRDQVAILVDGTVVPCCLDSEGGIALGNINKLPFGEIIGSPRAAALYEGFSNRKVVEDLCRRCGYRVRFNQG